MTSLRNFTVTSCFVHGNWQTIDQTVARRRKARARKAELVRTRLMRRIIDVHHGKTLPIIRDMEHRVAGRWNLCIVSSALAPLSHELWFSWNGGAEDPLIRSSHPQKLYRTCSGRGFRGICFRGFAILFVTTSLIEEVDIFLLHIWHKWRIMCKTSLFIVHQSSATLEHLSMWWCRHRSRAGYPWLCLHQRRSRDWEIGGR